MTVHTILPASNLQQAEADFRAWLGSGFMVQQDLATSAVVRLEIVFLPFFVADVRYDARWDAEIGILNKSEWNRVSHEYEAATARHKRDQDRGIRYASPHRPDKNDYMDWSSRYGEWSGSLRIGPSPAFSETILGEFKDHLQFIDKTVVTETLREASPASPDFELEKLVDDDVVGMTEAKAIVDQAKKEAATFANKAGDAYRALRLDKDDLRTDVERDYYGVPYYLIEYDYAGKTYRCVMDGFGGGHAAGPRPRQNKKLFLIGGVAAALVAGVVGLLSLPMNVGTQHSSQAAAEQPSMPAAPPPTMADRSPGPVAAQVDQRPEIAAATQSPRNELPEPMTAVQPSSAEPPHTNAQQHDAVGTVPGPKGMVEAMISYGLRNDEAALNNLISNGIKVAADRGDRKSARKLNDDGLALLKDKNYLGASEVFQKGLQTDPGDVEIAGNLAYALALSGSPSAEEAAMASIAMSPKRVFGWYVLGRIYADQRRYELAQGAFSNAMRFSTNPQKTAALVTGYTDTSPDAAFAHRIRETTSQFLPR